MATKPPTKTKLPFRKGAAKPSVAKRGALTAKAAIPLWQVLR